MAKAKARKKAKSKVKRKKVVARKKPIRKAVKKVLKAAKKVFRKPAPKAKVAKPASPPPPPPPPGERIGVVTHYYGHLSVAVVKLEPGVALRVGDNIHVKGHTSDFSQRVDSLQIGHEAVQEVGASDDFGLKVVQHAREHDVVYRVKPS
jgi:putative protease